MSAQLALRPQSLWLVRLIAQDSGLPEAEVEAAILRFIAQGHLRVLEGYWPDGRDAFEPIYQGGRHGPQAPLA
jgi:hypothetical protein